MAHYDLEEQEQIDSLRTWWKMYGNLVTGVVVAASLAVIGWQGWNWYQRGQAAQADLAQPGRQPVEQQEGQQEDKQPAHGAFLKAGGCGHPR